MKKNATTKTGLPMTLRDFCARAGSQEAAAARIGVSFTTVNRWLHRGDLPRGLSGKRLAELNIVRVG